MNGEISRSDDQLGPGAEAVEVYDVPAQFQIDSEDAANWLVKKIVAARAYAKHCDEWCEREKARARREEEFFWWRYGQQLREWASVRIREFNGRRKSVCLPAGTVGFRHEGPKLIVEDEQAVIAWARTNNADVVSVVERLSKSALNDLVERTGEMPDRGVRVEPEREAFYVK